MYGLFIITWKRKRDEISWKHQQISCCSVVILSCGLIENTHCLALSQVLTVAEQVVIKEGPPVLDTNLCFAKCVLCISIKFFKTSLPHFESASWIYGRRELDQLANGHSQSSVNDDQSWTKIETTVSP